MIKIKLAGKENKELYKNFFNILQNEFSEYNDEFCKVDEQGYFSKDTVDVYFKGDEKILPYLIYENDNVAGLVVLTKSPFTKKGCDFCIQEIFMLNYYRHKNISTEACKQLFDTYKGKYCLMVFKENKKAVNFWNKIIINYGNNCIKEDIDSQMTTYEFDIK